MSNYFFDYTPGRISARFAHAERFDYIEFYLQMGGESRKVEEVGDDDETSISIREETEEIRNHNLYMSSVFCPFGDFIRFLEAIAIDVQEVAFEWEAEGPSGAMRWTRRQRGESGTLMVEWSGRGQSFVHRTHLYTRDTVAALYGGFRSFVESADYDPLRYEENVTLGDCIPLLIPGITTETFIDRMVRVGGVAAMNAVSGLRSATRDRIEGKAVTYPLAHFLEAPTDTPEHPMSEEDERDARSWDVAPQATRREMLAERLAQDVSAWDGCNLRKLRSRLIEEWLARPAEQP